MHKQALRTVATLGFAAALVAGCTGQSATSDGFGLADEFQLVGDDHGNVGQHVRRRALSECPG